jgi:hypothetical protein
MAYRVYCRGSLEASSTGILGPAKVSGGSGETLLLAIFQSENTDRTNTVKHRSEPEESRRQTMEQNSSKGETSHKTVYYTGSGLAIGAAIGMIFGLMRFEHLPSA